MNELIKKINELAHKQKTIGLTGDEKKEQTALRQQYLKIFRSNFKNQLEHTKIQTPDGNLHPLKYMAQDDKSSN
ncbi:DUF896 domain-containing protein [Cellulosilyticum sp. I15G10I2]|uniref:DUF896 domain-containing protein n=1 Tax=Cellulosilyticum sp. I15G10I2 TaxID=1892843 RepID=UPI001FA72D4D|nr:DUF896 domain-containing protein [Cellulosilyticum sp. I15G10I2]